MVLHKMPSRIHTYYHFIIPAAGDKWLVMVSIIPPKILILMKYLPSYGRHVYVDLATYTPRATILSQSDIIILITLFNVYSN